ncbi:MAG TPA: alpha/beta hydrolase [Acidimicrobiales bacterium]|nr:alpha/beta hydrolase [Acidimicrobiales bacterium]
MAVADVGAARIAYDDTGGDGPAVVLAHGFLMDRSMFEPQVAALRDRYRMVTWDERGFGETEYDERRPFTYWDSAADCLTLMDHLGIDRAVVGGMSQGGFVSQRVALTAPERVRGLVLLDTQAGPEDPEVVPLYQGMIYDWVANGPHEDLAGVIAGLILGEPELSKQWIATWEGRRKESLGQPGRTLLTRDDLTERLGEITAPALVVHGTEDGAIAGEKAERLAAGLTGCDGVTWIEGGTHAANLTHPAEVNAAIAAFLESLPA